ncbi:SusE domain-containing protein [Hymenobacter terricola]|uniref:SusE domain-containing protein n=1 Tax=Hymenobacter terricola TaxID=2819236 RepID=UPI001B3186A4|nr:SusE domain-containing protein [Hymenobacter terricola]
MYNWFSKTTILAGLLAISLTACKKDETRVTLTPGSSPQLTASATTATLTSATAASNAVTYTWTPSDFGYKAAVSYTLQFAKRGTNFAATQDFNVGASLTKTITGADLNGVYNSFDCNISSTPSATPLDVRVKATVGDAYPASSSNTAGITATPYQAQTLPADVWAIIGSATPGGWNTETPMTYDFCSRVWKTTIALNGAAGSNEFKFRANNAWTLNLGDGGAGGALDANGANLTVPTAGNYSVVLNTNAKPKPTFTLTKLP